MLLALDTSTLTLSAALLDRAAGGWALLDELTAGPPQKQSELLPGILCELLARNGRALDQLTALVVGLGPGSFTGLRIGVATLKALAYARQLPVAGVSSLAAVALAGPSGLLIPIAVARQGELYTAIYRRLGTTVTQEGVECVRTPAELVALVEQTPGAQVLGPAVSEYGVKLEALGLSPSRLLTVGQVPSAAALAALAKVPDRFDALSLFALEPRYIGPSKAERDPKFPPLPGPAPTARIRED